MFLQPEPWTEQYFNPVNHLTDKIIPVDDVTTYNMYPQYKWVYNKMSLCNAQCIPNGPEGTKWPDTPIISKPIINLWGMSEGVYTPKTSWEQFTNEGEEYRAGNFWMPFYKGRHFSTDFVLVNGEIKWSATLEGVGYKELGTFSHWRIVELPKIFSDYITSWVQEYISQFTGIINIESIDEKIIECHLRLSPQFVNLYCPTTAWLTSVSHLYDRGVWHYNSPAPPRGYSVVLWTDTPGIYHVDDKWVYTANQMVESVTITYSPGVDIKFETGTGKLYRLAVANGFTYDMCNKALAIIETNIKRIG